MTPDVVYHIDQYDGYNYTTHSQIQPTREQALALGREICAKCDHFQMQVNVFEVDVAGRSVQIWIFYSTGTGGVRGSANDNHLMDELEGA